MGLVQDQRLLFLHDQLVKYDITSSLFRLVIDIPTMPVPIDTDRVHAFEHAVRQWMQERPHQGFYYFLSNPLQSSGAYAKQRRYQFYFTGEDITEDLRNFCFEARLRYM